MNKISPPPVNIRAIWATLFFMLWLPFTPAFSQPGHLRLMSSYFEDTGKSYAALQYGNIGLTGGFSHYIDLSFHYAVNENVLVGADVPYFFIAGAKDWGVLGNMAAFLKFSLARSDLLVWRLILDLHFRLATGIIQEDASRRVNNVLLSYYPFTTSTTCFTPSVMGSFLLGKWMINLSVSYVWENAPDTGMLEFGFPYDRVDGQIWIDYYFRISLGEELDNFLIIRPAVYVDLKKNLTSTVFVSDAVTVIGEVNFKWKEILRWKIYTAVPVYSALKEYGYDAGVQIGKIF